MAKLTKEQVEKYNTKAGNGFKFDIYGFLMKGEKELIKTIDIDSERYIKARVHYQEIYKKNESYGFNTGTGKHQIVMNVSEWTRGETADHSYGLGKTVIVDETPHVRRNFNDVLKATHNIEDSMIKAVYTSNINKIQNSAIF